jgi:bla regulator protein blaR1
MRIVMGIARIAVVFAILTAPAMAQEQAGRTVIDKTGLTGKYDMVLQWTPDESQAIRPGPDAPPASPSDSALPSIFTALQEQLGLKLESQKGPVQIFVIDRAEKPSEN